MSLYFVVMVNHILIWQKEYFHNEYWISIVKGTTKNTTNTKCGRQNMSIIQNVIELWVACCLMFLSFLELSGCMKINTHWKPTKNETITLPAIIIGFDDRPIWVEYSFYFSGWIIQLKDFYFFLPYIFMKSWTILSA